jgi:Zn-dependent peptidase ImmA (M78 family)/transcriptional regulator with XRE-family HTH domain
MTELARRVGITQRSVSEFESGRGCPSAGTLERLAAALDFPPAFFGEPPLEDLPQEGASFRSMSSMTSGQRDAAEAAGVIAMAFSRWLDERFVLPAPDLPDSVGLQPATWADVVRSAWGMGERPVKNMVHLLEAHGVRVFSLVEECKEVDAFSFWHRAAPYVFLNTMKSGERGRFDAAHELGHMVMHRHGSPKGRDAELEANAFASAFLMPEGSIRANAPRFPTLAHLSELRFNWNVSVLALIRRLWDLKLVSEWHYRSLCIEATQLGARKGDQDTLPHESSQILRKVFNQLRDEGITKADVARQLSISTRELDSMIFALALTAVDGGRSSDMTVSSPRGHLRLVK